MWDESEHESVGKLAYGSWNGHKRAIDDPDWLRAARQTRSPKRDNEGFLAKWSERAKTLSELVGRVLTFVSGASIALTLYGFVLLFIYLRRVGAPMPPVDASLTLLALVLGSSSIVVLGLLAYALTFTSMIKMLYAPVSEVFGVLFLRTPLLEGWDYFNAYVTYFAPLIGALIGRGIGLLIDARSDNWVMVSSLSLFVVGAIFEYRCIDCKHARKTRIYIVLTSVLASFCLAMMLLFLYVGFASRADQGWIFIITYMTVYYFVHGLFADKRGVATVCIIVVLLAIALYPGAAHLTSQALRLLRLGGGIPIQLILRSAPPDNQPASISGCLILATGSELLVGDIHIPSSDCYLPRETLWKAAKPSGMQIKNFERSAVASTIIDPPPNK